MESLHRQVLPFLLRRLKEDVLADLPPKIIQDYYCDLSPLQVRTLTLYTPLHYTPSVPSLGRAFHIPFSPHGPKKKPGTVHVIVDHSERFTE